MSRTIKLGNQADGNESKLASVPLSTSGTWFLLQIKTQQHGRAEENLKRQGFIYFAPSHLVKKIYRRQLIARREPLFPGYVFVQIDDRCNWRSLQATKGVIPVVSFNGQPQPVSQDLIKVLQQRFDNQGEAVVQDLYRPGEKVVITDGCFKHIEAIVKTATSDERIIVLLNILHSQQAVAIPVTQLAKAG